jgi:isopentenyldiphosphate isomerase
MENAAVGAPAMSNKLTDPDELLEVYDAEGRPTGRAKSRGAIHRDGDWHLAFFCWVARPGPRGPELLLQRRSFVKDVWPGRFDASSAGHVRFRESLEEAAREIREELGIEVELRELVPFGRHRQEHHHPNGLIDREHHALHLLAPGPPDELYRPSPLEVLGLAWAPVDELVALVEGRLATVVARYRPAEVSPEVWSPLALGRDDLVPYAPGYHVRLAELARAHV